VAKHSHAPETSTAAVEAAVIQQLSRPVGRDYVTRNSDVLFFHMYFTESHIHSNTPAMPTFHVRLLSNDTSTDVATHPHAPKASTAAVEAAVTTGSRHVLHVL
jgi:hypothetical protein